MRRKVNSTLIITIFLSAFFVNAFGQVVNNRIDQRIHLIPDGAAIQSSTAESTVEWECINKKLTNKCIVYHNDQWFTFSVSDTGNYFLNVANQVCRDLYGIQMIIIEGNPCDTENYIIKRCISKVRMDDMFVELGMLKANQKYLLNVDGFLGDYCSFEIQLATKPSGIPEIISAVENNQQAVSSEGQRVHLTWNVSDSLLVSMHDFEVYRKELKEKKFTLLANKNIQSNAAGAFVKEYSYHDSLFTYGVYEYMVLAKSDNASIAALQHQVTWAADKKAEYINHSVTLPLTFSKSGVIDVLIMDPFNDWVLQQYSTEFTFKNPTLQLFLNPFYKKGMRQVKIKVKNSKIHEVNIFYYEVGEGKWNLRQPKGN